MQDEEKIAKLEKALLETIQVWDKLGNGCHHPHLTDRWVWDDLRPVMDNNKKVMKEIGE